MADLTKQELLEKLERIAELYRACGKIEGKIRETNKAKSSKIESEKKEFLNKIGEIEAQFKEKLFLESKPKACVSDIEELEDNGIFTPGKVYHGKCMLLGPLSVVMMTVGGALMVLFTLIGGSGLGMLPGLVLLAGVMLYLAKNGESKLAWESYDKWNAMREKINGINTDDFYAECAAFDKMFEQSTEEYEKSIVEVCAMMVEAEKKIELKYQPVEEQLKDGYLKSETELDATAKDIIDADSYYCAPVVAKLIETGHADNVKEALEIIRERERKRREEAEERRREEEREAEERAWEEAERRRRIRCNACAYWGNCRIKNTDKAVDCTGFVPKR